MSDLAVVYVIRVDGDTSDADNLFVSKRITATGAEYSLSGPLAKAIEAAINAAALRPLQFTRGLQPRGPTPEAT